MVPDRGVVQQLNLTLPIISYPPRAPTSQQQQPQQQTLSENLNLGTHPACGTKPIEITVKFLQVVRVCHGNLPAKVPYQCQ